MSKRSRLKYELIGSLKLNIEIPPTNSSVTLERKIHGKYLTTSKQEDKIGKKK